MSETLYVKRGRRYLKWSELDDRVRSEDAKRIARLTAEVSAYKACIGTIRSLVESLPPENISVDHVERYTREVGAEFDRLRPMVEAAYREGYAAGNPIAFDANEQWDESDAKRALDGEP